MRLSLRTKQVLGVTALVGGIVVALSVYGIAQVAHVRLEEGNARGELLANAIYQRAFVVVPDTADPYLALKEDGGLKAILQSAFYSKDVTYAAVVDPEGIAIAHSDPEKLGRPVPQAPPIQQLLERTAFAQLKEIFGEEGRTYEVREQLARGNAEFGSIRIGISTLLVRNELEKSIRPVIGTALTAIIIATLGALLLAQWLLRPIHVLRSDLKRLGRGEPAAAAVDLPQDEFGELGREIRAVSDRLLAGRAQPEGSDAALDSIVENLADAAGIFGPNGEPLFANPALRALLAAAEREDRRPFQAIVERTHEARASAEPVRMQLPSGDGEGSTRDWLVMAHPVEDRDHQLLGVMVVARDLQALGAVETTIRYSRKLAALGRLTAGVAHEVKNPLNAMTIHLELLKGKLGSATLTAGDGAGPASSALEHVGVIGNEIRRLDQVVQGFLKFMRPEDLQLQAVPVGALLQETARIVAPDAAGNGVRVVVECPPGVPDVHGDPGSLRQALLNLAINACHAMPTGGTLRLTGSAASNRRVAMTVEDTGTGISAEHLARIFDLYFTTKPGGSGIGLSMVFRTVQLHDGEIEVESTPRTGTVFRLTLPRA